MKNEYPILEYDPNPEAMIEPHKLVKPIPDLPKSCVICFFQNVIDHLDEQGKIAEVKTMKTEMGEHPVYILQYDDQAVTLFHPGIGAPLAAGLFEEVIALGCETFVVCGGAGVLAKDIAVGHLLIPTTAIRDEGTSYHYLPPGREVSAAPEAVEAIELTLKKHDVEYLLTKTWTTDAFYRETPQKIALRRSEGCLTVEMEAAALFAVAQFRGVRLGQILYGGDDLSGEYWDSRKWTDRWTIREQLVWLAAEASLTLAASDSRASVV